MIPRCAHRRGETKEPRNHVIGQVAAALLNVFSSIAPVAATTSALTVLVKVFDPFRYPEPPTGFAIVSAVLDVAATGLAAGKAAAITQFPSGVGFLLVPLEGVTIASGYSVSLVYFNTTAREWRVCSAASPSGSLYAASCPHLTPFALMSSVPPPLGTLSSAIAPHQAAAAGASTGLSGGAIAGIAIAIAAGIAVLAAAVVAVQVTQQRRPQASGLRTSQTLQPHASSSHIVNINSLAAAGLGSLAHRKAAEDKPGSVVFL
eukprot:tig00001497_g9212.t1